MYKQTHINTNTGHLLRHSCHVLYYIILTQGKQL